MVLHGNGKERNAVNINRVTFYVILFPGVIS